MTPQRQYLETTLLPMFGASFAPDAVVLNIGAGSHTYREQFRCQLRTADPKAGCDETYAAESIPYATDTVDGILFNGVFDRLDDPMQAMRECARVLKPGGSMLFGAAGLDFDWHSNRERWCLTPAGAAHVVRDFRIRTQQAFGRVYYFSVLEKPA